MEISERAQNAAAAMLGRKFLTCQELFEKLCRKGFSKEVAEKVIENFLAAGYLDDRRYAELYLTDSVNLSAKGLYRIRQELLQKGVARDIIQDAIDSVEPDVEAALSRYMTEHHIEKTVHTQKDLEKLRAKLLRRGYSLGEIQRCLAGYNFRFEKEFDQYE